MLGDNRSGRELVIPTENIKSDSTSGFMRDSKQPINIINIITEDDIAAAMAGAMGQRVIINTVGKDMRNRGSTIKSANI